jgi:hypothetical protein
VRGFVPPDSVVIPGTRPKRFMAGEYGVPCALIIGRRKESTDTKTSLKRRAARVRTWQCKRRAPASGARAMSQVGRQGRS